MIRWNRADSRNGVTADFVGHETGLFCKSAYWTFARSLPPVQAWHEHAADTNPDLWVRHVISANNLNISIWAAPGCRNFIAETTLPARCRLEEVIPNQ